MASTKRAQGAWGSPSNIDVSATTGVPRPVATITPRGSAEGVGDFLFQLTKVLEQQFRNDPDTATELWRDIEHLINARIQELEQSLQFFLELRQRINEFRESKLQG